MAMVRAVGSRLLLVITGAFLAFALAEGVVRVADIPPRSERNSPLEPHELFGWFHVPNSGTVYWTPSVYRNPVKINSHGLREREYAHEKGSRVYRLLILGDSFTASFEVPFKQTWHEILEDRLNANGQGPSNPRIEIIAAGVQGWGTDQQLLYYRYEGYRYDPDMVVLQFFQNDVLDNVRVRGKPRFVLDGDRLQLRDFPYRGTYSLDQEKLSQGIVWWIRGELRERSHVYRLARNTVLNSVRARQARTPRRTQPCRYSEKEFPRRNLFTPTYAQELAAAWKLTVRLIRELDIEVANRHQRFGVIYIPDVRQVVQDGRATLECRQAGLQWDLDKPNRLLRTFARTEGIFYLDLTSPLREHVAQTGRRTHLDPDGHLNPEGHQVTSKILYEWLMRERLVPHQ